MPGRSKETNAGNGGRRNSVAEKHLGREQNSNFLIPYSFTNLKGITLDFRN